MACTDLDPRRCARSRSRAQRIRNRVSSFHLLGFGTERRVQGPAALLARTLNLWRPPQMPRRCVVDHRFTRRENLDGMPVPPYRLFHELHVPPARDRLSIHGTYCESVWVLEYDIKCAALQCDFVRSEQADARGRVTTHCAGGIMGTDGLYHRFTSSTDPSASISISSARCLNTSKSSSVRSGNAPARKRMTATPKADALMKSWSM